MGVDNEKSRLFIRLITQTDGAFLNEKQCPVLIDDDRKRANEMVKHINKAVLEAIARQPYASSNVLMYTIATVVCTVLKLDYDMWKFDSEGYMETLIRHLWPAVRDMKVEY